MNEKNVERMFMGGLFLTVIGVIVATGIKSYWAMEQLEMWGLLVYFIGIALIIYAVIKK